MTHKPILAAISGVARCGKDSFAALLVEHLTLLGQPVATWAFADCLKRELEADIWAKYGISVWTQDSAEKAIIRDDLVAHGKKRRNESNGRHWVDQIDASVRAGLAAGVHQIIKDCRFATNNTDEAAWVHSLGGKVIHLTRLLADGQTIQPAANLEESRNDPLVFEAADIRLTWPTLPLDKLRPYVQDVWTQLNT